MFSELNTYIILGCILSIIADELPFFFMFILILLFSISSFFDVVLFLFLCFCYYKLYYYMNFCFIKMDLKTYSNFINGNKQKISDYKLYNSKESCIESAENLLMIYSQGSPDVLKNNIFVILKLDRKNIVGINHLDDDFILEREFRIIKRKID